MRGFGRSEKGELLPDSLPASSLAVHTGAQGLAVTATGAPGCVLEVSCCRLSSLPATLLGGGGPVIVPFHRPGKWGSGGEPQGPPPPEILTVKPVTAPAMSLLESPGPAHSRCTVTGNYTASA